MLVAGLMLGAASVFGQGVTTASFFGQVASTDGQPLAGATVIATHVPSGTKYGAVTRDDGRFNLPSVRVGGPYTVRATYIGYVPQEQTDISLGLGQNLRLDFSLQDEAVSTEEVSITASRSEVKNGAATNISNEVINSMPTLSRRLTDFVRLTPQFSSASFGNSFGGQDNRLNNITIDGSSFNNSFGLAGQPGDRTGVSPISLDAIEQVQVNIAPFDVRQAGFVGAGINAVTRSGSNDVSASAYFLVRNQNFLGDSARGAFVPRGDFLYYQTGLRVGGPIIKDKLFFFVSGEIERNSSPATTFRPREAGEQPSASDAISRVLRTDLEEMTRFLDERFGYETGPYNDYNLNITADKLLVRFDYNIDQNNKFSLRYNYLNSGQDVLVSNSSSLGFGGRQPNVDRFSYRGSNYIINEDIQSVIAELNSTFSGRIANTLTVGFTYQDEDRGDFEGDQSDTRPTFPLVEIQDNGSTYMTVGYEPFTPYNQLSYSTFQLADNLTYFAGAHKITAGFNLEHLRFRNVFFPGSQSVYVYQSLSDFYADADSDPNTVMDTTLRRFQIRYSAIEGQEEPVQPTRVTYTGLYLQDEWQASSSFNITAGIRVDIPFFANTGYRNPQVDTMTFFNPDKEEVSFATDKLPNPIPLISPRIGFNWNATEDGATRIRGGSGLFTGRPAFVWISNQIGNNGVLTGFTQADNTSAYPFNPNITTYIPANAFGQIPATYELALTESNFRFPQVWRTNLAVEQKLPLDLVGTVEVLLNKDVNGVVYYNANLDPTTTAMSGPDTRGRYNDNRYNNAVVNAIVLANTNQGSAYSLTFQVERPFRSAFLKAGSVTDGFYFKAAYNFGQAKNLVNAGSIAAGSFNSNPITTDPNNPELAFSNFDQRHRWLGALSYRLNYGGDAGASTQISLVYDGGSQGRASYTVNGDLNGDGAFSNELIYVPTEEEINAIKFQEYTSSGTTFTVEQQRAAFNNYIEQDEYLSSRRGSYAERNGVLLPMLHRMDVSLVQEFYLNVGGKRNVLQFRADMINFTNFLNSDWGVSQAMVNNRPMIYRTLDNNEPVYRFANVGSNMLSSSFRYNNSLKDVWQLQIGVRYIFN
ncbi:MAG: carboxypeptidase regulatory-like domain-containing protein [Bacteroidia bacterium]